MIGAMFDDREVKEIEYLLKNEMDELMYEIKEVELNHIVKRVMEERYQLLFNIYKRFASSNECLKYLRQ